MRSVGVAAALSIAICAAVPSLAAPASVTPLPPVAGKRTSCPRTVFEASGQLPVTVMVAAQKGKHPAASLLSCTNADAIALAGKQHFLKPPFRTGEKIEVAGTAYTLGVGGPEILPATSGPVYGWFGNGIEVLLILPSGR